MFFLYINIFDKNTPFSQYGHFTFIYFSSNI